MANRVIVRSGLDEWDELSLETGLRCEDATLAVQSQKDEADINVILERFHITGQMPESLRIPKFEDFGDTVFDFRSALEAVEMAEDAFMSMPAKVRSEFDNDPQTFMEFCADSKNLPRMRELGLAKPEVAPEPEKVMKVEVVSSEAPATPAQSGSGGNPQ